MLKYTVWRNNTSKALDLDVADMLQLLDKRCKATMINMLNTLMEIVDNVQKQVGNLLRDGN